MAVLEIVAENFSQFLAAAVTATRTFGDTQPWWRGQSNAYWKLSPGVFRTKSRMEHESNRLLTFMQRAPVRHARCPPESDFPAWLCLMQHYRLPTRLLDWSRSASVAAVFAMSDRTADAEDGAIWALSPTELNKSQGHTATIPHLAGNTVRDVLQAAVNPKAPSPKSSVVAVRSSEFDIRMLVQMAEFSIHATAVGLEETAGADRYLVKVRVPSARKASFRQELNVLGMTEGNLFPDLDHLAKEVGELEFSGNVEPA